MFALSPERDLTDRDEDSKEAGFLLSFFKVVHSPDLTAEDTRRALTPLVPSCPPTRPISMSTCGDLGWKARPSAAVLGPFAFPAIPQEGAALSGLFERSAGA